MAAPMAARTIVEGVEGTTPKRSHVAAPVSKFHPKFRGPRPPAGPPFDTAKKMMVLRRRLRITTKAFKKVVDKSLALVVSMQSGGGELQGNSTLAAKELLDTIANCGRAL